MQRNTIRVSVGGDRGRISEEALRNVLKGSSRRCDDEDGYGARKDACDFPSLAMVYAPYQRWEQILDLEAALACGTLFRELNKPFEGGNGCPSGNGRGGCNYGK